MTYCRQTESPHCHGDKLYAHKIIPNLTENILICDSDIIFIKDTYFFDNDNYPLYGSRVVELTWYQPYLNHHLKLCKEFDFGRFDINKTLKNRNLFRSGICHHIIYNKYIINNLEFISETCDLTDYQVQLHPSNLQSKKNVMTRNTNKRKRRLLAAGSAARPAAADSSPRPPLRLPPLHPLRRNPERE